MHAHRLALRPWAAGLALTAAAGAASAFDSGSTGADGALTPTVNTEVVLPASGILNYSSINIPTGVTVTFRRNATNTPVVLLVQGSATVAGSIDLSGTASAASGSAGDGVLADDGVAGNGGPGGYGGGRGGRGNVAIGAADRAGGKGLGPGGGIGGPNCSNYSPTYAFGWTGGNGGSFGGAGGIGSYVSSSCPGYNTPSQPYGAPELLPLIGGSGGGGGSASGSIFASGGGGGGGALLIAASGTLTISGTIRANGGGAGAVSSPSCTQELYAAGGGGGSGGAIRLIATTLTGNGNLLAQGGGGGSACHGYNGGAGAGGRIRIEAETLTRTGGTTSPSASVGQPGPIFIAGTPTLKITTIAGAAVPDPPTGSADVQLPETTPNPVSVTFATTGIPVGNTVRLSVAPANGSEVSTVSTALTGSTAAATANASVNLPAGASTLQASITYTVIVALGEALSRFAGNERVERITITAGLDGRSTTRLITVSGREFVASPEALRVAAMGG